MNIIPVIQRFMEDVFSAAGDFMENPGELMGLEERISEAGRRSCAGVMAEILNDYDVLLSEASGRREKYTVQRHDPRTLVTTFGDVVFSHTYFRSRSDGGYHYLLDEMMNLPRNERLSDFAETAALTEASKSSYQRAAEEVGGTGQTVSKATVMNRVHSIPEELPMGDAAVKRKLHYLYIEADEDHIHRQKSDRADCIMGKLVYIYEYKRDVCAGRRELVRPAYFGGEYAGAGGTERLWRRVQEYIEKNYDADSLWRVYISGDGAAWIKAGAEYVDKSVLVADRFHLMKYICAASNQMLDESEAVKGEFYRLIYGNDRAGVADLAARMKESAASTAPVEACERFLMNNWEAVQRAFHDGLAQGCSAEGHVSAVYSDRMSSRPMGWSGIGADRMCRLRCLTMSGGDGKIADLVRYRRLRECERQRGTGTDGIIADTEAARKRYGRAQREAAAYAERMHATLGGTLTRKQLAIKLGISL